MAIEVLIQVSRWARTEYWRRKPSVEELIQIHHELHRRDRFAKIIYMYPFGKDILAKEIKELIPREDYEFFVARITPSNEFLGWVALSFSTKEKETEDFEACEARLEWTEMCSHILKMWKNDSGGEKSNIWDTIKQTSSRLREKHLPRNHCIINALILYPQFEEKAVANKLLERVIEFWKTRVKTGTEWAIWVQAPPFIQRLYYRYGFEEVGEYSVELGNYGFLPKEERTISGKYAWKFMVLKGTSESRIRRAEEVRKVDKAISQQQPLQYAEQRVPVWEIFQDQSKEQPPEDTQEHIAAQTPGKSKEEEQRMDDAEHSIAVRRIKKGKSKEQQLEDPQEHVPSRNTDKGKGKEPPCETAEDPVVTQKPNKGKGKEKQVENPQQDKDSHSSHEEPKQAWEEAEQRLEEIRSRQGPPPLPGEVACLVRIQRRAEESGLDITLLSRSKAVEKQVEEVPPEEPLASPLQHDTEVTSEAQDNFTPTKSDEDLIDLMRREGIDEEEIELVKAIAFSLSDDVKGG